MKPPAPLLVALLVLAHAVVGGREACQVMRPLQGHAAPRLAFFAPVPSIRPRDSVERRALGAPPCWTDHGYFALSCSNGVSRAMSGWPRNTVRMKAAEGLGRGEAAGWAQLVESSEGSGGLASRRMAGITRRWGGEAASKAAESRTVSRHKLDKTDIADYQGDSLFHRFAQAVCALDGVVPRKELHENWEAATRIQRHFPDATRIADLASGNGLLSWALLMLDETGQRNILCVDKVKPPSAGRLSDHFISLHPEFRARHRYAVGDLADLIPQPDSLLVAVHGCGRMTDTVIEMGVRAQAPLALMPCCHSIPASKLTISIAQHPLGAAAFGHVTRMSKRTSASAALDQARIRTLRHLAYEVTVDAIPEDITPHNRLIIARPPASDAPAVPRGRAERLLWPLPSLPPSPWRRFADGHGAGGSSAAPVFSNTGAPVGASGVQERRALQWGSYQRRDSFLKVQSAFEASNGPLFFMRPRGTTAATSQAFKSLSSAGAPSRLPAAQRSRARACKHASQAPPPPRDASHRRARALAGRGRTGGGARRAMVLLRRCQPPRRS
jgi:hypothetical protein